ncbi:MAG: OmpA family protein [Betaproteobacteria bacterium]|nr:OmpA family protein [Betaproteobacteria bacterium]
MSLKRVSGTLGLVAFVAIISPYAVADDVGWYGGANVGESRAKIDDGRIMNGLAASGYSTTSISNEGNSTAFKIFGGYQFNPYFALEGGYFDLGQFGFAARTVPPGILNGNIRLNGVNMDAVGILPITQKFSAFGRVGVDYAQAQDSFSGTGAVNVLSPTTPSKWDTNYDFGAGLQYAVTESIDVRAEAERYRINDAVGNMGDIDVFSLGLIYRFGHKAAPAPAPQPVVAAPEPAPAPVVVIVTPPPAPHFQKYTMSAMELFTFDSTELRSSQPKLDEIAHALNHDSSIEHVMITGYTDRIGSAKYNMNLSERRAVAVKDYLISKGVDGNRLRVQGKGFADPVVKCTNKKRADLIKCLAPNRRVEVEQITVERRIQ